MPSPRSRTPQLPKSVERLIDKWAKAYGVDPNIAKAQAWQESRGKQSARSRVGAIGVMQLMPKTAKELRVDPTNVEENIKGGMKYLSKQLKAFKGNYALALAAYNAGPGSVRKAGGKIPPFKETQNYVKTIMGNAARMATGAKAAPRAGGASRRTQRTRSPRRTAGARRSSGAARTGRSSRAGGHSRSGASRSGGGRSGGGRSGSGRGGGRGRR